MTQKTSPSSNVFLFYGEDDFSLRRKIDLWKAEFAKKFGAAGVIFFDAQNLGEQQLKEKLQTEMSPSLFASKKLIIVHDALPKKADQKDLAEFFLDLPNLVPKDYFLIFWESSRPDKRLGFTKKFLNLVAVTEFVLPHGLVLNQWIKAMAKNLGSEISDAASDRLAQFLGRDLYEEKKFGGKVVERKEAFDLWQVYSELLKLASSTAKIEPADVSFLVRPKIPDSVFALTNEMVAKNQKGALQALENFLSTQTTEEKNSMIKVVGLLAEQIRSLLIMSLLSQAGRTNEEIAEKLGWSPGRVFITAKNMSAIGGSAPGGKNISIVKLKELLAQLLAIDHRIKSTDTNTKLDIDLFLVNATN